MKRRVLLLTLLIAGLNAMPARAAFDSSEYRQATYGPPTHYCNPARSLASNGAGTLEDPWNLIQAMTLAVAGNVVGVLPGVGVRLPSSDNNRLPTFRPTNSGTATRRIVFVTKYAAVALPNVATNANRTQLRHDGTPAIANGAFDDLGTASPMFGVYGTNYATFDGFFVDMAEAEPTGDGGVIRIESGIGIHVRNFEIKGTRTNMGTNPVVYRPQNAVDTVLSNFRVYDFSNDRSNSITPQAALFSDQYGDQNFLIEHFEIRNTERGIFLKGTAGAAYNYGTIRYGIVSGNADCYRFGALPSTNVTTLEYSLCYDITNADSTRSGIQFSAEVTTPRNLLIHHVTVARVRTDDGNVAGAMHGRGGFGSNVTIRDSLFDLDNGTYGHLSDFGEISTLPAVLNHNGYTENGQTLSWAFNGVQHNSIGAWRTASGKDTNSLVMSSTPFVDRANRDFRVVAGHPAMTASSTGGQLGAYASGINPGVDVGSSTRPPAAPTGLRITGQ